MGEPKVYELVADLVSDAEAKNRRAANRMYEALIYIVNVGSGEARNEALRALRYRDDDQATP